MKRMKMESQRCTINFSPIFFFFKLPQQDVVESINLGERSEIKKCHMLQPTSGPILILHSSQGRFV